MACIREAAEKQYLHNWEGPPQYGLWIDTCEGCMMTLGMHPTLRLCIKYESKPRASMLADTFLKKVESGGIGHKEDGVREVLIMPTGNECGCFSSSQCVQARAGSSG